MAGGYTTTNSATDYATDTVWRIWNGLSTSATTTSYTANCYSHSTTTDTVWHMWVRNRLATETMRVREQPRAPRNEAETIARIEAINAANDAKAKAAKAKARALLVEHLSAVQRETYEKHGHFDVELEGKTYRIKQGTHGNVALVDAVGVIERYCVQPNGVPDEDAMLAQKLALECCPTEFFRKANVTRVRS